MDKKSLTLFRGIIFSVSMGYKQQTQVRVNLLLGSELIYTKELLKYSLVENCLTLLVKTCRNNTNSLYHALCKPESIKLEVLQSSKKT